MKLLLIVPLSSLIVMCGHAEVYSPASFDLTDGFKVIPQFKTNIKYNDNIYTSEANPTSSFVFINHPSISFGIGNGTDSYGGTYSLISGIYSDSVDGEDDYLDHILSFQTHTEFTSKHRMDINLGYSQLHDDRGSDSTDSIQFTYDEPLKYNLYHGKAYYEFGSQSATINIGAGVQYNKKVYQNFVDDTQYDDTEISKLLIDGAYKVGNITYLTLGLNLSDIVYSNTEPLQASQNNNNNNFSLGLRWAGLGKTTGSIKLGYQHKYFEDSSRDDFNGSTIDINLDWRPRSYSSFKLNITRSAEDSSTVGDYILDLSSDLTWAHNWNSFFKSTASIGYSHEDYVGSSTNREDRIITSSLNVNYDFSRWLSLTAGYGYTDKSSNIFGYGYDQNTVNLGIKISL